MLYHDVIPSLPNHSSHPLCLSNSFIELYLAPSVPAPYCPRLETLDLSLEPGCFSEPGPSWKSKETRHRLSASPIWNNLTWKSQSLAGDWEQSTSRVLVPICSKAQSKHCFSLRGLYFIFREDCSSAVSVLQNVIGPTY